MGGGDGEGDEKLRDLRESVGNVESRRERVGDEVGEAEETNRSSSAFALLLALEIQCGSVTFTAYLC